MKKIVKLIAAVIILDLAVIAFMGLACGSNDQTSSEHFATGLFIAGILVTLPGLLSYFSNESRSDWEMYERYYYERESFTEVFHKRFLEHLHLSDKSFSFQMVTLVAGALLIVASFLIS